MVELGFRSKCLDARACALHPSLDSHWGWPDWGWKLSRFPPVLRFIMFLMQDLGARFMWRRETTGRSNWILPTAPPTQGMICDGIIKGRNTGGPNLFLSVKIWRSHLHSFLNNPWGSCWAETSMFWAETYMFCSVFPVICTCLPICSWESLYAEVESTDSSAYCQGSHHSSFQLWAVGSNFSGSQFIISEVGVTTYLPHWAAESRRELLVVKCLEEHWLSGTHTPWVFSPGPLCLLS